MFALVCLAGASYFYPSPPSKITEISEQDRDVLRQFFYRILYKEGLIYVLFGSKPMAGKLGLSTRVCFLKKK